MRGTVKCREENGAYRHAYGDMNFASWNPSVSWYARAKQPPFRTVVKRHGDPGALGETLRDSASSGVRSLEAVPRGAAPNVSPLPGSIETTKGKEGKSPESQ